MKKRNLWLIIFVISAGLLGACSPKARYDRMLKRELATGVRHDSLFLGLYLGMPEKDFYTHCWQLNGKGIIRQGTRNMTVEYQLKKEFRHPATMDFYPGFVNGKIYEMPVRYYYNGWAPWNKTLAADSLQIEVYHYFEKQYGKGFIEVQHPKRGTAFVKIDGNRQISIFKEDDINVWAVFTDMMVKKEARDSTYNAGKINSEITKETKK